jgi:hypothetical protein
MEPVCSPTKSQKLSPSKDWGSHVVGALHLDELLTLCSVNREWCAATRSLLVYLRRLQYTRDALILPSPQRMTRLTQLDTSNCTGMTPNDWLQRFVSDRAACARLLLLRIGQLVPTSARNTLLRSSLSLKHISLRGCENVDDNSLSLIRVSNLWFPQVSGSLQAILLRIHDMMSSHFTLMQATQLSSIDLSGCWRITDEGVTSLAARCPAVTMADLRGLRRLSGDILLTLSTAWPHLEAIAFSAASRSFHADSIADFLAGPTAVALEVLRLDDLALDEGGWGTVFSAVADRFRRRNLACSDSSVEVESHGAMNSGAAPLQRFVVEGAVGFTEASIAAFTTEMCTSLNSLGVEIVLTSSSIEELQATCGCNDSSDHQSGFNVGETYTVCDVQHTAPCARSTITRHWPHSEATSSKASMRKVVPLSVRVVASAEPAVHTSSIAIASHVSSCD